MQEYLEEAKLMLRRRSGERVKTKQLEWKDLKHSKKKNLKQPSKKFGGNEKTLDKSTKIWKYKKRQTPDPERFIIRTLKRGRKKWRVKMKRMRWVTERETKREIIERKRRIRDNKKREKVRETRDNRDRERQGIT